MAQDILYSSDATRLLQDLESASVSSTRLPAIKDPEHLEALHDLFGQAVGISKESEVPAKPRSPRMTSNELKAMKVASSKVATPNVTMLQAALQFAIRTAFEFKAMFAPRVKTVINCKEAGHYCAHCEKSLPF